MEDHGAPERRISIPNTASRSLDGQKVPNFLTEAESISKKKHVPLRIGIPLVMVSQVVVAVGLNWLVLWISCDSSINGLAGSMRGQIAKTIVTDEYWFLANTSSAVSVTALDMQNSVIDFNDTAILRQHLWTIITTYTRLSTATVGFSNGNVVSYTRQSRTGQLQLIETLASDTTQRGMYNVDEFGFPVQLVDTAPYNATNRAYFQQASQAQKPVWTTVEALSFTPEFGVAFAFPVFSNGKVIAVVTSNLILRTISMFLSEQQYGSTGSCMIVDRNGNIIATSVVSEEQTTDGTERLLAVNSPVTQFSDTAKEIVKRYGGFDSDNIGNFTFRSHGQTLFVTVSFVIDPRGIDWVVVIMIPRSDWFSAIDKGHWIALILCIGLLIVAVGVAIWTAYLIIRPLQRMAKAMTVITTKMELIVGKHPNHSSLKEIAMLQESFARLLHTLSSFMKYVPVEVVRLLVQHNAEPVIGMESRDVTLFFSDIADFTTIAEQMEPGDLVRILSEYLGDASNTILQSGGTLADYIGDAVFAFWNAPNDVLDHPSAACEAALKQQECINALNAEWTKQGLPNFKVRMGIHTGFALCGNSGSGKRMKYTAIGDSVNLASRLENLNKRYGTRILVTGAVFSLVREEFLCRPLDVVMVKGRRTPTWIFELICRMEDATPERKQVCKLSSIALGCYMNREFDKCLEQLNKIETILPNDKAVLLRKEKCRKWLQSPPPPQWTGVEELSEK